MKGAIISLIFIGFISTTTAQKLTLNINGWNNDTIIVNINPFDNKTKSSTQNIIAKNGSLTIENPYKTPVKVTALSPKSRITITGGWLTPHSPKITTFIFPDTEETITGKLTEKTITYTSSGCNFLTEYAKVQNQIKPYETSIDSLQKASANPKLSKNKIPATVQEIKKNINTIVQTYTEYIIFNPTNPASLLLLLNTDLETRKKLLPTITVRMKDENCISITQVIQESISKNIQ